MKCKHCDEEPVIMVNVLMSIPESMGNKLSKLAIRDKRVELWGASWNTASYICRQHGKIA